MYNYALPLAFVVVLGIAGAAAAAETRTTGTIRSLDTRAMTITLQNGTVYDLPAGIAIADFRVGEKVTVTWDTIGARHEATAVTAAS